MKERPRLIAVPASLVGDRIVELRDFGLKVLLRSHSPNVAPHVDAPLAKEAVPANVIEVLLRIDDAQLVSRPRGGRVSVDSLRRQRVPARIYHQRQIVANRKARIHAPWRRVSKTGNRVATIGQAHATIVAPHRRCAR